MIHLGQWFQPFRPQILATILTLSLSSHINSHPNQVAATSGWHNGHRKTGNLPGGEDQQTRTNSGLDIWEERYFLQQTYPADITRHCSPSGDWDCSSWWWGCLQSCLWWCQELSQCLCWWWEALCFVKCSLVCLIISNLLHCPVLLLFKTVDVLSIGVNRPV